MGCQQIARMAAEDKPNCHNLVSGKSNRPFEVGQHPVYTMDGIWSS